MKKRFLPFVFAAALAPLSASAQILTFHDLMQKFVYLIGDAMRVLYAAAFAAFIYGIALFIFNTEDEKKRADGKWWMFWSVIALFVMVTVWGIVGVLVNTFGTGTTVIPLLPGA